MISSGLSKSRPCSTHLPFSSLYISPLILWIWYCSSAIFILTIRSQGLASLRTRHRNSSILPRLAGGLLCPEYSFSNGSVRGSKTHLCFTSYLYKVGHIVTANTVPSSNAATAPAIDHLATIVISRFPSSAGLSAGSPRAPSKPSGWPCHHCPRRVVASRLECN